MLVTVEMKSQSHEVIIQYDYGNLVDTRGRIHSVGLIFHPDGCDLARFNASYSLKPSAPERLTAVAIERQIVRNLSETC